MRRWLSGIAGLALLMTPGISQAADASAGIDVYSAYVWRGMILQDTPVVQPWLDVSGIPLGKNVSLGINIWGNLPLSDVTQDGSLVVDGLRFSEFDPTLTLTLPKGFKLGYVEYDLMTTDAVYAAARDRELELISLPTRELFAGWAGSLGTYLDVSVNAAYDIDQVDGFYGSLALSRGFTLTPKLTASIETLAGVVDENFAVAYGGTKAGLFNYNLTGKLSFAATEKISLGATFGYIGRFDDDVLPEEIWQPKHVYGGVTASIAF